MKYIFYVVFTTLVFFTVPVLHAETVCVAPEAKTLVVFGNGIMNTPKDMAYSLVRVATLLYLKLSPEEFSKLKFDLARNKSYGLFKDLYESAKQKLGSDNVVTSFWRWMGDWKIMPAVLKKSAKKISAEFDFSTMVAKGDLSNQVSLYRTNIMEGNKILVVSHSQGNFFANASYDLLFEGDNAITDTGSFGIVAVATPASFVAGGGPYTTLVEDNVIRVISLTTLPGISQPLPANITNILSGGEESDLWGHSFLSEYMAKGSRSVTQIMGDVEAMINSLIPPIKKVQSGIITVTLTWGPYTDVDLHIFEPNGSHIYYENKRGVSGYLDLDDVDGDGPEHYYVSCSTLEDGVYKIGVNYFTGNTSPETAFIQIKAGLSIRSYTVKLESSKGVDGNNNPVPVADITVTGNSKDGYSFSFKKRVPQVNSVPTNITLQ